MCMGRSPEDEYGVAIYRGEMFLRSDTELPVQTTLGEPLY